jgi:hypothetical protein
LEVDMKLTALFLVVGVMALGLVIDAVLSVPGPNPSVSGTSEVRVGFQDEQYEVVCLEVEPWVRAGVYSLSIRRTGTHGRILVLHHDGALVSEVPVPWQTNVSRERPCVLVLPGYFSIGIGARGDEPDDLQGIDELFQGEELVVLPGNSKEEPCASCVMACRDTSHLPVLVQGYVAERTPDGDIGAIIPGATIVYASEDGSTTQQVTSDEYGRYSVVLPLGRYRATAEHPDFRLYDTSPGWHVVTDEAVKYANFFLTRKPEADPVVEPGATVP